MRDNDMAGNVCQALVPCLICLLPVVYDTTGSIWPFWRLAIGHWPKVEYLFW